MESIHVVQCALNDNPRKMASAQAAALVNAQYKELVRVVTYAIEDIPTLEDKWFVHDNTQQEHHIKRNGETFDFLKEHYSKYMPTYIGFDLYVPRVDATQHKVYPIWVTYPQADTSVNRRATIAALQGIIRDPNLQHFEQDAREFL